MKEHAAAVMAFVTILMDIVGAHLRAWTPPTGLMNGARDVIGMKLMMNMVVPRGACLVFFWEVRMITVATAEADLQPTQQPMSQPMSQPIFQHLGPRLPPSIPPSLPRKLPPSLPLRSPQ